MSGLGGIVFVVQGAAFSSSHLSLTAWLVRHPVSGICDCPHGNGFCWFVWCLRSLPETFRSLRSSHAQGLGNYPAAGIWLAQADGSLPCGDLIPPCSIVVLTSTQVLLTDSANCRARSENRDPTVFIFTHFGLEIHDFANFSIFFLFFILTR